MTKLEFTKLIIEKILAILSILARIKEQRNLINDINDQQGEMNARF